VATSAFSSALATATVAATVTASSEPSAIAATAIATPFSATPFATAVATTALSAAIAPAAITAAFTRPQGAKEHPSALTLLGPDWLARWRRSSSQFPPGLPEADRAAFIARFEAHAQFARGA
jgi:queuine tRNA-ribosyltransferase